MAFRIHTKPGPIRKPKRRKRADKTPLPAEGQRQPRQEDERYLACIRLLPSIINGEERSIEACHIRMGSAVHGKRQAGLGEKPDDKWTVPLTMSQHRKQHSMNERTFWQLEEIDPLAVCERLWEARYDVEAMREIVLTWNENGQ